MDALVAALLTANCLSGLTSCLFTVWLCRRMWLSNEGRSKRLFPRQLQSLLFADFLFSLSCLSISLVDLLVFLGRSAGGPCKYVIVAYQMFGCMTLLNETHIAVSFAVQSFRLTDMTTGTPSLTRLLPWVSVLGLVLGLLDSLLYVERSPRIGWPSSICILACFLICSVAHVVAIRRERLFKVPACVGRTCPRAALHLLSFLLTRFPTAVVLCSFPWWKDHLMIPLLAAFLSWGTGFVHVIIFPKMKAITPPRARGESKSWRRSLVGGSLTGAAAWSVDFGGVDFCETGNVARSMESIHESNARAQSSHENYNRFSYSPSLG